MSTIVNAIIKAATIGTYDDDPNGFLTAGLTLDYGGGGQGFGGFALYRAEKFDVTGTFVARCMQIAGVTRWEHLVGKPIRVETDEKRRIVAIGHFLKDEWFNASKELPK